METENKKNTKLTLDFLFLKNTKKPSKKTKMALSNGKNCIFMILQIY